MTSEPYNGATRQVQYFDKARMEVNNPAGDPTSLYYVTTGLLVKELVTGQRQDGNNTFTSLSPSTVQVAGDFNVNGANANLRQPMPLLRSWGLLAGPLLL